MKDGGSQKEESGDLPDRREWLCRGFTAYVLRMIRRQFGALRVLEEGAGEIRDSEPLLVFSNHPSWWDPLVATAVAQGCFPNRAPYAPIDGAALEKYGVFRKLGFFGVDQETAAGARKFLRTVDAILAQPDILLWVTAQGEFQDVRQRPVVLKPGIAAAAARSRDAVCLPVAIEYAFGPERLPEVWVRVGPALRGERRELSHCARALEGLQDRLAESVRLRDGSGFRTLLQGKPGVGGIYDLCRRTACWVRGRRFDPKHLSESS